MAILPRSASSAALPEWVELIPAGKFHGRDGRGPYHLLDAAAVGAASRALGVDAGLPIDYDHATDLAAPNGQPAPAAGWIRELSARAGALWGRVEWTPRAQQAIEAREYRYLSPVFQYNSRTGNVVRLLRAGLTNNPNLHLTAIAAAYADGEGDMPMEEFLARMRAILGLGPDATPDEIVAAAETLCQGADASDLHARADLALFVPVAEYERLATELNAMRAESSRERAGASVDEAIRAGRLTPAQREWAIGYAAADPVAFASFAARQPAIFGADRNLGGARAPENPAASALSRIELSICAQLGLAPAAYQKRKQGRADFLPLDLAGHEH